MSDDPPLRAFRLPDIDRDPRRIQGSISDPHDRGDVAVDTTNALLLEGTAASMVDAVRDNRVEETAVAIEVRGRVNKTDDKVSVLMLTNVDGAAAFVSELIELSARAGFYEEFKDRIAEHIERTR